MNPNAILSALQQSRGQGRKLIALLVDPDKASESYLSQLIPAAISAGVDYFLVGGSLIAEGNFSQCVKALKKQHTIPVIIFPGNSMQVSGEADAILFLSLISGRNPEFLIGQQVKAAPLVKRYELESIPTGYILVDGGRMTAAQYMSNTLPVPADKPEIAATTAIAGELLGLQCIYMDAGSGAQHTVPMATIRAVRKSVQTPIIVGGGIKSADDAKYIFEAGADMIVIGTAAEKDPEFIAQFTKTLKLPV